MALTHKESTCGQWCAGRTFQEGSSCADPALRCKDPWPGMAMFLDPAHLCDERCVRSVRPADWRPGVWEEVRRQTGSVVDSLAMAGREVGMALLDWKEVLVRFDEAKTALRALAPRMDLPAATRREVGRLLRKAGEADKAVAASDLPADLKGWRPGPAGYQGGGLLGLRGLGGPAPSLGAAPAIAVAPLAVVAIAGGVVVVGYALANMIAEVVSGTAKVKVCLSHSEGIQDPKERAEFVERCGGAGGLGPLGMIGLGVVMAGAGWLAWRRWGAPRR